MTSAIVTDFETLFAKVKAEFSTDLTAVEQEIADLEAKLLPGFKALVSKIVSTIGSQGVTIIEQGVEDLIPLLVSGGNIGAEVTSLIANVPAQVNADLKQDAATAAHGVAQLLIAALPVPAPTAAELPAA